MEDYSINISVKKNSNISNKTEKIVNFLFSHYKSMGIKSCHSNQSSYPTGTKTLLFVPPTNDLAEIVNFHFSNYKSMGTISCHSNLSSYPTRIKNTIYVEANVLSMYAKFRIHPIYGF